ncbi:YraN family protein [Photobacterium sp. BZF1]|uniref:YraN family protein n=1 Tax=Photobacterium TaxID=657 RepID=UPI0016537A37|nr:MULTISPECIES: YraN family protein [Photobacterium]MBC7002462.1 YraN family protein [Photobacterium sp. BZF1]MBY5947604.1 YraN family protein [Photobacterium rosenbergii]
MSLLNKRQQGQTYEAMAEQYLCRHGLHPHTRNFQCRSGEIDLIMRSRQCWVFVEVKFRKNNHYGSAAEAVNWRKQQRVKRAALFWLKKNGFAIEHTEFRFDVVSLEGTPPQIEWFTNTLVEG